MCEQSPALFNPPTLSAQELNELLLKLRAAGSTTHRKFIDALRAMEESKLYLQLGYHSLVAYADAVFHYGRSQTYELVRVSKALADLPEIAGAFEHGEFPFSLVARLTRVATGETECLWIEHSRSHPRAAVELEIRDAERKGRKHPRKDGYGLPGLPVKITFELSPEEHALVSEALKKVSREMGESLDGAQPEPKAALLYLARRILETDPKQGITDGRTENGSGPYAVVLHRCPDCLDAAVDTDAGRIEVSKEAADRICAEREERERRSSPRLRREALLREGDRCANPYCRRDLEGAGHAHHIKYWSEGGRTELENLVYCCGRCHSICHAGFLEITGDPERGLTWRVACKDATRSVREALDEAWKQPEVRVVRGSTASSKSSGSVDRSGTPATGPCDVAVAAMRKLGCSVVEAQSGVAKAWEQLEASGGGVIDAGSLLLAACRMG